MKTLFAVIVGLAVAVPSVADAPTSSRLGTLQGHTSYASSVAFSPDGKILACDLVLWDVANQSLWASLQDTSYVYAVAFSSDGTMLASASSDHSIALWDVARRGRLATLKGHTDYVLSGSFSPDGTMFASGSSDNNVILWDVATQRRLTTLKGHTGWVQAVAFSPDGTILASGAEDGTVLLWRSFSQ